MAMAAMGASLLALMAVASFPVGVKALTSGEALSQARKFQPYAVYGLGASHTRLPMTRVLMGRASTRRRFVWSFIYGDCRARAGDSCAPPLEVQNYDACRRNLGQYQAPSGDGGTTEPGFFSPPYTVTRIRGATVALFPDDPRVEVYTGRTAVVIFARSLRAARDAVKRLRPVNRRHPHLDEPLPAAVSGASEGALRCS